MRATRRGVLATSALALALASPASALAQAGGNGGIGFKGNTSWSAARGDGDGNAGDGACTCGGAAANAGGRRGSYGPGAFGGGSGSTVAGAAGAGGGGQYGPGAFHGNGANAGGGRFTGTAGASASPNAPRTTPNAGANVGNTGARLGNNAGAGLGNNAGARLGNNAGAGLGNNVGAAGAGGASGNGAGAGLAGARGAVASQRGVVEGTVLGVDYGLGVLEITNGRQRVLLRGTPTQLGQYKQGELARVAFKTWGGTPWIVGGANGVTSKAQTYALHSTVVGTVTSVNKANGTLTLTNGNSSATYLTHPTLLRQLVPGEFVTLTYEQVQNEPWVSSISPAKNGGRGATGGGNGGQ